MINMQRLLRIPPKIQGQLLKRNIQSLTANRICVLPIHKFITPTPIRSISFMQSDTVKKFLNAITFFGLNKSKLKLTAFNHYENTVDRIDYMEFIEELDLPDTFYSWFVVTELHLWMLSARAMVEGNDGKLIRNTLVEALWTDVLQRVKKLGSKSNPIDIRSKIVELSEQLQAAYIAYDEGVLSDDIVLAGALWRRVYQKSSDVDTEHLEKLVKYIRRNMRALELLDTEQFYNPENIKWGSITT